MPQAIPIPADATIGPPVQSAPAQSAPTQAVPIPDDATIGPAQGFISRVWDAAKQEATNIGSTAIQAVEPPTDAREHLAMMIGGQPGLVAYRAGRGVVNGVENAVKAKPAQFQQAVQDAQNAIQEFHGGNYRSAAADFASTGADVNDMAGNPLTQATRARAIAQGTKQGGDLATPVTKDIVDAIPAVAGAGISELGGAADAASAADSVTTELPADAEASAGTAKAAFLPKGQPAVAEGPSVESTSPAVQDAIRKSFNNTAQSEGLKPIPASTAVSDLGEALGNQFFARSKAIFAQVQDVTGLDLNALHDQISVLEDKINDAIDNPEKAGQLEQQKLALEDKSAAAFQQFKDATGTDPAQAEQDWKKYNASYDVGKKIAASTVGRSNVGLGEITDATKLAPRLNQATANVSATQPGRLVQLAGPDEANTLADAVEAQRGLIKDFTPSTATGQNALQNLIRQNTGAGKQGFMAGLRDKLGSPVKAVRGAPITDWSGTVKDFDTMPADEVRAKFGPDAPQVRKFLVGQARNQILRAAATSTALGSALGGLLPKYLIDEFVGH